ncbi:MAG: septum formation protein Maf [Deltaproteobacteria bacterium]|nr:septum formation protein Maf [Deltaproteobacteria bacterium]
MTRFITKDSPLVLASASPRRKRLLRQIGIPFRTLSSRVKEDLLSRDPLMNARLLAEAKAQAVVQKCAGNWILGADTIVVLNRAVLGKPSDEDEAFSMLRQLSGKEHRVITGFCLVAPDSKKAHSEAVVTRVTFKALTRREILGYVATGEPFGKAGSYGIQGIGAFLVKGITGSYTNVVGLPLSALVSALLATGALKEFPIHS